MRERVVRRLTKEFCRQKGLRNFRPTSSIVVVICSGGNPLRRHKSHVTHCLEF